MNHKINIAIDGPAAAGKSTISKKIAEELKYVYIDTGAMYRAITLHSIRNGMKSLYEKDNIHIRFSRDGKQHVFLNNEDVTHLIRTPEVTTKVSEIASLRHVREYLVDMQREIAQEGGVVMDGRDIGTTVLPDAELKIYMVADPIVRAKRRLKEEHERGNNVSLEMLTSQIKTRDELDMNREISPLKQAKDAILLNTSQMTIEEVKSEILNIAKQKVKGE